MKHTNEPWFSDGESIWRRHPKELYQNGGGVAGDKPIATFNRGWYGEDETGYPVFENARRTVACVNVCHGLSEDELIGGVVPAPNFIRMREQRDELLAALKAAESWIRSHPHGDNCFVSNHYEGDPGNKCNCGKESVLEFAELTTEKAEAAS